jgi:hypothetical protein
MNRIAMALAMVLLMGSALQTMGQAKGGSKPTSAGEPAAAEPAAAEAAAPEPAAATPLTSRKAGGEPAAAEPAPAAAEPAAAASSATLTCTSADGSSACTDQQVADVNQGILTGRRMHKPFLMTVKGVTQGSIKGTLECTQDDGSGCSDDQLSAIISLASTTHSSDGEIVIMKEVDKASPMLAVRKAGGDQPSVMLAVRKAGGQPLAALTCTGADGTSACTDQQVTDLNQGLASGKRRHQPLLMNVEGVTQGTTAGTLVCTQTDGSACTDDQVSEIISLASIVKSSDGTIHITREVDATSPK